MKKRWSFGFEKKKLTLFHLSCSPFFICESCHSCLLIHGKLRDDFPENPSVFYNLGIGK